MHPIFARFKAPAKAPSVSTHFALMTDLNRFWPDTPDHPQSHVPGVVMSFEHNLPNSDGREWYVGTLVEERTETPTALFAMALGQHLFIQMLNPLDPALRKAMEQHRDAQAFPQLIMAKGANTRPCPRERHWDSALKDTEGRKSVDPTIWLANAEGLVDLLPTAFAASPFASAEHYHFYFVVPDDEHHPLYSRVG